MGGPSSGATAMPLNTTFSTAANSGPNYFNGTVCVPNGSFSWGGNATTAPGGCNYPVSGVSNFCTAAYRQPDYPGWGFSVRWHGLFPFRRRVRPANSKADWQHRHACGLNNDVKAKIHLEENSDTARFPEAHVRRGWRGPVLVEATIIVPILVVMSVYVMDFGLTFYNKMEMQNAAQAGAQWAIANRVYNCFVYPDRGAERHTLHSGTAGSPSRSVAQFCGCSKDSSGNAVVTHPGLRRAPALHRRPEFDLQLDRRCGKLCHGHGNAHKHVPFVRSPYLWSDRPAPPIFPQQRRCAFNETKTNMG